MFTKKIVLVDNPMFRFEGYDRVSSPETATHLRNKAYISIAVNATENLATDQLNVVAKVASSGIALARLATLRSMAQKSRSTGTIADWLYVVSQMAMRGAAIKSAKAVGAVAGIFIPFGGLLSKPVVMYLKSGKADYEFVCTYTALELHWRAFVENKLGGGGPAMRILEELFRYPEATTIPGKKVLSSLVNEPAGWIPIKKLLLSI